MPPVIISGARTLILPAYYCEFSFTSDTDNTIGSSFVGACGSFVEGNNIGGPADSVGYRGSDGDVRLGGVTVATVATATTADRIGVALFPYAGLPATAGPSNDKGVVKFFKNGTLLTTVDISSAIGSPLRFAASVVTNDSPIRTITGHFSAASWLYSIPANNLYLGDNLLASYFQTSVDDAMTFVDEGNAILTNGNLTLNEGASVHTPCRSSVDIVF